MKHLKRLLGFLVLAFIIVFCSSTLLHNTVRPSPEVKALMERKIDEFHQNLTQEKFVTIYSDADPELKKKFNEQEFVESLRKAKEKFGNEIPKANLDSRENLINTIRRKFGKPVVQYQSFTVVEKPNYKSEMFRWVIYSNDDVRLLSYDY